jgi:predicted esterase YcpF (UPF0227 family)
MILYIHGFRSCGLSVKSRALQQYFGQDQVLTPDLPHRPLAAIQHLESLLQQQRVQLLVGSSLGGYFATWLKREHDIPAVLINPAIAPALLLEDYLGTHQDCYGRPFEVTPQTLGELRSLHRPSLGEREAYLVLLQTGDEILDYRQAATYYADKEVVIEQGGNHRFENLSEYLPRIQAWARQYE